MHSSLVLKWLTGDGSVLIKRKQVLWEVESDDPEQLPSELGDGLFGWCLLWAGTAACIGVLLVQAGCCFGQACKMLVLMFLGRRAISATFCPLEQLWLFCWMSLKFEKGWKAPLEEKKNIICL